ncbi:unnamed protein product [Chironomus riparius]|uniref:Ionotropic receptor n=1 Tax=Chironomus riparius TaxID=315576 RepID=A0A9N9WY25_9DIPT|nr:unnamed protein product [Chironomus riparius]
MSSLLSVNHMSKFLIVTSDAAKLNPQNIQKFLNSNGIQNFAIIAEEGGSVAVQRPETFNGEVKVVKELQKPHISSQIYPDKLKNLQGYKYKVAIDFRSYPITSRHNRIVQRISHLFRTIAKLQNATFKITRVKDEGTLKEQKFDFTLNSMYSLEPQATSSVLYNKNSFCILLPKVNKHIAQLIAPLSTDYYVVMCLIVTYVCIFVIWKLYKSRGAVELPGVIIFKIFGAYNGQGADFSQDNRLVLKILIQFMMIMAVFTMILNQWSVGNSLAYPKNQMSLKDTYKALVDQEDSKIAVNAIMEEAMSQKIKSYYYIKALDRIVFFDERTFNLEAFNCQKMAIIGHCEFLKVIATQNQHFFEYPLPSILSSTQIQFGPHNPFADKIEELMKHAFESGLPDIWETMIKMKIFGKNYQKSEAEIQKDLFSILGLDKLLPLYYTCCQGLGLAFAILIIEILYHDCIRHLSWQLIRHWTASMVSRSTENINWQTVGRVRRAWYFWRQRRNLKVQRINVRFRDV